MPIGKGTKVVWNLNVEVRDEKIDELGGACQRLDVTAEASRPSRGVGHRLTANGRR